MNKSELFTQAHALAKTFTGDYSARFALAITELTGKVKAGYEYVAGQEVNQNEITMSEEAKEINTRFRSASAGNIDKGLLQALKEEMIEEDNDLLFAVMNYNGSIKGKAHLTAFNYKGKLYVAGNTYKAKEELKEMGFTFKGHFWVK